MITKSGNTTFLCRAKKTYILSICALAIHHYTLFPESTPFSAICILRHPPFSLIFRTHII